MDRLERSNAGAFESAPRLVSQGAVMSLYSSMSPKAIRNRIERDQTTGNLEMRQELRSYRSTGIYLSSCSGATEQMKLRGAAMVAEADEQLALLDACEMGMILPILEGGTIELRGTS
jgi:hypothetical protein